MKVNIYVTEQAGDEDENGVVLVQSFTFHIPCSKNLFIGDIFRGIKIVVVK